MLGLDIGARFLRGAICDLSGDVRARQDVELPDVEVGKALDTIAKLRTLPRRRVAGCRAT